MSFFARKTVVITGAASGIGRALARQLSTSGARLALSDIDSKGLAETMLSLHPGCDAVSYPLDGTGVRAVCVHPGGIKTNIDKSGRRAAVSGRAEDAFDKGAEKLLLTPPEECAADIVAGITRGDRRILTGNKSTTLYWLARLLPNRYPAILKLLSLAGGAGAHQPRERQWKN